MSTTKLVSGIYYIVYAWFDTYPPASGEAGEDVRYANITLIQLKNVADDDAGASDT